MGSGNAPSRTALELQNKRGPSLCSFFMRCATTEFYFSVNHGNPGGQQLDAHATKPKLATTKPFTKSKPMLPLDLFPAKPQRPVSADICCLGGVERSVGIQVFVIPSKLEGRQQLLDFAILLTVSARVLHET